MSLLQEAGIGKFDPLKILSRATGIAATAYFLIACGGKPVESISPGQVPLVGPPPAVQPLAADQLPHPFSAESGTDENLNQLRIQCENIVKALRKNFPETRIPLKNLPKWAWANIDYLRRQCFLWHIVEVTKDGVSISDR